MQAKVTTPGDSILVRVPDDLLEPIETEARWDVEKAAHNVVTDTVHSATFAQGVETLKGAIDRWQRLSRREVIPASLALTYADDAARELDEEVRDCFADRDTPAARQARAEADDMIGRLREYAARLNAALGDGEAA